MSSDPAVVEYLRNKYLGILEAQGEGAFSGGKRKTKRKNPKSLAKYRLARDCFMLSHPGASKEDFSKVWCEQNQDRTLGCYKKKFMKEHPFDQYTQVVKPTKKQYEKLIKDEYKKMRDIERLRKLYPGNFPAPVGGPGVLENLERALVPYVAPHPLGAPMGQGRRKKRGMGIRAGIRAGVLVGGRRKARHHPNPWIEHVRDYWAKHPNLSYKQAMQKARASY